MKDTVSLNTLYADYRAGLLEKKELEGCIYKVMWEEDRCLPGWKREDYEDFVSWLYPRVSRAIDKYQDTGSSFESYMGSLVRLTAKEYRIKQIRGYVAESAAWVTQAADLYFGEPEPDYDVCVAEKKEKPAMPKNPRQLLILTLKYCSYISEDFIDKVSAALGMESGKLAEMAGRLTELRKKRILRAGVLREKANCQFFRNICYEKSLKTMAEDSAAARRIAGKLERGRLRLANMRIRLARLRLDPSNLQIANILGVSKGTVDTVLHTMRLRGIRYLNSPPAGTLLN